MWIIRRVCNKDQRVACPKPQGLLGWSDACALPVLPTCNNGANVDFYKVEGVEHYNSAYNKWNGPGPCLWLSVKINIAKIANA